MKKFALLIVLLLSISTPIIAQETAEDLLELGIKNYWSEENKDLALDYLNRAIELDETLVEAYAYRGSIYRIEKDFDAAKQDLMLAIELDPDSAITHAMLSRLYYDQKELTLARATCG